MNDRRLIWLGISLSILFLVGCSYGPVTGPRRFDPAAEPTLVPTSEAVARPLYTIEQGLVVERLTVSGRVSPRFEVPVQPPKQGRIVMIDVSQGDFVAAGDRIALYDSRAFEADIADVEAQLAEKVAELELAAGVVSAEVDQAQLELDIATLELELAEEAAAADPESANPGLIDLLTLQVELAQGELDRLDGQIDADGALAAEIADLEAQLAELQAEIEVKSIVAPIDGMVLGISIGAGDSVNEEQTVAIIGQMGSVEDVSVSTNLRSEVLEQMAEGMSVTLEFESLPGETFTGTVARLPYPYNSGGNDLAFDPADTAVRVLPDDLSVLDQLSLGEPVEVTILLAENRDALWLPAEAIREFSGRTFIVVQDGDREQRIDIERGLEGDGRIEIIGSVEAGQQVVGP